MQKNRRMDSKTHEIPFVEIERKYVPICFGVTTEFGILNLSFWVTTTAGLQGAFRNFKLLTCVSLSTGLPLIGILVPSKKKGRMAVIP